MNNDTLWQTKLAARIHDPAEKALVLLRDPAGHEGGTSRALTRLLGFGEITTGNMDPDDDGALSSVIFKKGIPLAMYKHVQRADWWAAAADRPQWPMEEITVTKKGEEKTLKVADWAQVHWTKRPVLIHPLTADQFDLGKHGGLSDTDFHDIKDRSFGHFSNLFESLEKQGSEQDWRKILLTYWRFGPELSEETDNDKLGALWKLLPADTRVPDHSIWDHLDLTSAFAGAFAADPDGEAALLALSIGPVQSFIAAARKMDDLWAGSHLLSRLSWEAMRPVCEALGPDAILFPRLRGIPQVDLWLRDQMNLPDELFKDGDCKDGDWMKGGTDANPLFSAALPNRFVAVVPASQARKIAEDVQVKVREWLLNLGEDVVSRLLKEAGFDVEATATPCEQMKEQLAGFPEVHWAAVPFSLIHPRNAEKQTDLDVSLLSEAMAPFFGVSPGEDGGFLASDAWKVLREWESALIDDNDKKSVFFAPNPGVLYPAVYDLAERVMAAAKATRAFGQTKQKGWRCSLTGETEWLTANPDHLTVPAGKRKSRKDEKFREGEHVETLWTKIADEKPSWAKKGEHLGALSAIKRLWPDIFAKEVGISRFVVSTHTMALAGNLETLDQKLSAPDAYDRIKKFILSNDHAPALPKSLAKLRGSLAASIPAALDRLRDSDERKDEGNLRKLENEIQSLLGCKSETYYALLMMDGDKMGAILSGDEKTAVPYRDSFHPQVQKGFDEHATGQPLIKRYGEQKRPISPNRHLAISGALNDFSQTVVRHVVEEEHLGRVIYAGGDDVLAMLPVADLLSTMQRLRHAYSGTVPEDENIDWGELRKRGKLVCKSGFAYLNGQLLRMMGKNATASCGAVIAHHQAPLPAVMRELREAEKRAKNEGGRDAFSITVIKRSGGALRLTEKWGEPVALLNEAIKFLCADGVSRQAVYNSLEWLHDLPDPKGTPDMLESLLAYQFKRQIESRKKEKILSEHDVLGLARRLAALAAVQTNNGVIWLQNFLSVAEFLARETRHGGAA